MKTYTIAAFYKFVALKELAQMQSLILEVAKSNHILGTFILAEEGINGTIAGSKAAIDTMVQYLRSIPRLSDLTFKYSYDDFIPFQKIKVLIKNELVALGIPSINPQVQRGQSVLPEDWNALIMREDVLLIDTRNEYEIEKGTFKNALNPHTETFNQFPKFVEKQLDSSQHKQIAMFCTGGIRCEKASAYLLAQGFEHIYQLEGGILNYLEKIDKSKSLWQGDCFIFDERLAINEEATKEN